MAEDTEEPTRAERTRGDEVETVWKNRYGEALKAGLSLAEAELFADSPVDVGLLRKLVAGGATPAQIALIVI